MKVKSGIVYNSLQTILEFSEKPLPVKLAGKLLRLANDLQEESRIVEKQRQLIIEKYGKKDENNEIIINNNMVNFESEENALQAQKELNELSESEIEITDRNITEEELENAGIELTMTQFAILENFFSK